MSPNRLPNQLKYDLNNMEKTPNKIRVTPTIISVLPTFILKFTNNK